MQAQETHLMGYLTHGGCTYKLVREGDRLILEVENPSGQKAATSLSAVDCSSFAPKLDPLSKSSTSQVALTFKEISGRFKSCIYSFDSSSAELTEQGSGYEHNGKLLNINACGSVNREKLCAVYEESNVVKVQVLSVNSDTGVITSSAVPKTISGLESSTVTAISAAEVGTHRIVVLAKDGTTLKKGSSTGSSIAMSTFTPTGGLSGNEVDRIIVNACKESKACAIVGCTDGKLYYLKSNGNTLSSTATEIMKTSSEVIDLSVEPEYGSGSSVSRFNLFVTNRKGEVTKGTFAISGNQCEKSSSVTITKERKTATNTPTNQARRKSTSTTQVTAAPTQKTTTPIAVRRKSITSRTGHSTKATPRTTMRKKGATGIADTSTQGVIPTVVDSSSSAFHIQHAERFIGNTTVQRGNNSTTVAPSDTAVIVFATAAGGIFLLLLLGFLYLVYLVYQRRARIRRVLESGFPELRMEELRHSDEDVSDDEMPGPLEETRTEREHRRGNKESNI
ncbi:hypothetical protein [Neorickettsia findlayensis]|uniref:Uncharacterized protein n=1 Tax=Neorickettsia findlayensis TaxID=2686014 RepID=A0A6P1GBH3_9RICK|nr:hypothetical protein [Neorickettsia findlayensis]QHD65231.1 hypothetical protein GP480_02060 [Neorickettsia findlayensis]